MDTRLRQARDLELAAASNLRSCQNLLRVANEVDSQGQDGDALLIRENAYWQAQEATYCYSEARKLRLDTKE